ncbi:MAG: YidC/Oxa1 family membrane protein insertase [Corallococcus sp.]|nr:YidC/Oxa1 family membrane protein insertase [Corallococcus sp.]
MKRKTKAVIKIAVILCVCILVFAGCRAPEKVDLGDYMSKGENGIDNLNWVGKLVMWMHGWVGQYGWTVVVFTVFLKILTVPFDIWQRIAMRKSSLKMQKLSPILEDIDKRYGANTKRANDEKQKIYKKQSVSTLSSCLPMILSMAIFFIMFGGLNSYATYNNVYGYYRLNNFYSQEMNIANLPEQEGSVYYVAYQKAIGEGKSTEAAKIYALDYCRDIVSKGSDEVFKDAQGNDYTYIGIGKYYVDNVQESFLWMASIWQPDTWKSVMPTYAEFTDTVNLEKEQQPELVYNIIRDQVLATHTRSADGSWNGLMILPVMSIGLSFLSMFINQKMDKKNRKGEETKPNDQQAMSNKMMMIIMPLMMAFFGFMYTGAFAVYMVCNYMLSILTSIAMRKPVEIIVNKQLDKEDKKNNAPKASYKR